MRIEAGRAIRRRIESYASQRLNGGSDADPNGFLEAKILDSHRVIEKNRRGPEVSAVGVGEETAKSDSGQADWVPEMVEE